MAHRRTLSLFVALAVLGACEHGTKAPRAGTTTAAPPTTAGAPAAPAATGWAPPLGPVLLVQGESPNDAIVVTADASGPDTVTEQEAIAIRSRPVVLLGHGESVQVGLLQAAQGHASRDDCEAWPLWQVEPAQASGRPLAPWAVGFATDKPGAVEPIALDSVQTLGRGDSAHVAAEVTRLASTIAAGAGGSFQGLPFTVTSMWRFRAAAGVEGVAATLVRRIAEEARPLEERTFLIAERDSTRRDALYELAFHERSQGAEETNESTDLLAALRLPDATEPAIVISRDFGDGTAYGFVERGGPAHWRVRWTSRRAKC